MNPLFDKYYERDIEKGKAPTEAFDYAIKKLGGGDIEPSRGPYRGRTVKPSDFTDEDFQPEQFRKGHREGAEHKYSYHQERSDKPVFSDAKYPRFRYAEPEKKTYEENRGAEPRPHKSGRDSNSSRKGPHDSRNPKTLHKSSRKHTSSHRDKPSHEDGEAHRKHPHPQQRFKEEFAQWSRQSGRSGYSPPGPGFGKDPVFEKRPYTYTYTTYETRYQQPGDNKRSSTHDQHRSEQYRHRQPPQSRTHEPRRPLPKEQPLADYYAILRVAPNATAAAIKKAFRQLALESHPDRVADDKKGEFTAKMAELNMAYGVLSDEEQRQKYDLGRR